MKTRQEMIYEFMLALSSSSKSYQGGECEHCSDYVYEQAVSLVNKFLENAQ
jgi:hypothetical protein